MLWIALTIIVSFFLQPTSAASTYRPAVSWLLLGHVFVGTHLLLGLLALGNTIPWYQGVPLQSFAAGAALAATAISLLLANFGFTTTLHRAVELSKLLGIALAWLQDQQPGKARDT